MTRVEVQVRVPPVVRMARRGGRCDRRGQSEN